MDITIKKPKEFSYTECYRFLGRDDKECLHRLDAGNIYKLLTIRGALHLIEIENSDTHLHINCINKKANTTSKKAIIDYVTEWLDLDTDLKPFYQFCKKDPMLKKLAKNHNGLRMIGIPDLFENLVWAIIGQQINLNFAYSIKQKFVEKYGNSFEHQNVKHYQFPDVTKVSELSIEELRELQFSRQKANYTINVANAILQDGLSKKGLKEMGYSAAKTELIKIKGVGAWTADYALMKCVRYPKAIPLGDVGLQNALKEQLKMENKPTKEALVKLGEKWDIHSSYICFYLWQSLLKNN